MIAYRGLTGNFTKHILIMCLWAKAPFSQGFPKLKASTTKIPLFGGVFVYSSSIPSVF